ncbi:MAG: ATP-binding protein [Ferruginibacter sp.]
MKIKDIVNRTIVDLTNCDQELIHIPGSIQPHGFLLALNDQQIIEFCSGNIFAFCGVEYTQVLRKQFLEFVGDDQYLLFQKYLSDMAEGLNAPLVITIMDSLYNCNIHRSDHLLLVEMEPVLEKLPGLSVVYNQTVQFVKYMQDAATLQHLCGEVAREIKSLTGYDRVMVYRFDNDYNGEVYAECKRDDLESFLGLHYPHTDIPAQARLLYIKNLLRIIVDVNYQPVPIYTVDEGSEKNIDLSLSVLRSTSPIHVQYLQNMGVNATLTISLLYEGKLWGLIACHHYSPKYIDHYTRISAQLQGHFLTSQIGIRQIAEEYKVAREVNNALENMLSQSFMPDRESIANIILQQSLLSLCNADGIAIVLNGMVYKNGDTAADDNILEIAAWAGPYSKHDFFATSKLVNHFPDSGTYCSFASGIIFHKLGGFPDACIMWFNPETLEEVNWAGDPAKSIEKNKDGLSPRKSFETWKIITKCQAREWLAPEVRAAATYAHALQKHITMILLNEEEQRQRILTNQLKSSNDELENINWISTHDLKEPLRKIQMFTSKLLVKEPMLSFDTSLALNKINDSAGRMQRLIESLTTYNKARHSKELFEMIDLDKKIRQIAEELIDEHGQDAEIKLATLPSMKGIPVLIQQLFVNLLNNALKFANKNIAARIEIYGSEVKESFNEGIEETQFYKITVKDNGIGFDPEMKENIFKIFTRLNPLKDYEGSGIGLALCKKIMQMHNGHIDAANNETGGASFYLYFPQQYSLS